MKAGAMVALLVAAILALAVVPSAHAGRDLLGGSSSDEGKKVSIAGAEADTRAYGRYVNASLDNTVVAKPGLAYSKSGSTAKSSHHYYSTVSKADGKALSKGDFAKTHTDTAAYTVPHTRSFTHPSAKSSSNSSAVSVSGHKQQGNSSSDKGKKVSIAGAKADAGGYGYRAYAGTDNTVVAKPGLSYSKSGSTAGSSRYHYSTVAKADGKALAKGDFAKTHTDTTATASKYSAKSSLKSSAVSVSG